MELARDPPPEENANHDLFQWQKCRILDFLHAQAPMQSIVDVAFPWGVAKSAEDVVILEGLVNAFVDGKSLHEADCLEECMKQARRVLGKGLRYPEPSGTLSLAYRRQVLQGMEAPKSETAIKEEMVQILQAKNSSLAENISALEKKLDQAWNRKNEYKKAYQEAVQHSIEDEIVKASPSPSKTRRQTPATPLVSGRSQSVFSTSSRVFAPRLPEESPLARYTGLKSGTPSAAQNKVKSPAWSSSKAKMELELDDGFVAAMDKINLEDLQEEGEKMGRMIATPKIAAKKSKKQAKVADSEHTD